MYNLLSIAAVVAISGSATGSEVRSAIDLASGAQVIVLGKVTTIESEPVKVASVAGQNPIIYRVANIAVEEGLYGTDGEKQLRVLFQDPADAPPNKFPLYLSFHLKAGQEGCFFLREYSAAKMLSVWATSAPILSGSDKYEEAIKLARRTIACRRDPIKQMKSDDPLLRFLSVTLWHLDTYRMDAKRSDLVTVSPEDRKILYNAMLSVEWDKIPPEYPSPTKVLADVFRYHMFEKVGFELDRRIQSDNFLKSSQKAFQDWVDGPGRTFELKRGKSKSKQ